MKGSLHQPRRHKHLFPVLDYLKGHGAEVLSVTVKRHVHIAYVHDGIRHRYSMAGSPSVPEHATWNAIADLRRVMEGEV